MRVGAFRGRTRHLRAGAFHDGYCIGCCWSLMLALMVPGLLAPWYPGIVPGCTRRPAR